MERKSYIQRGAALLLAGLLLTPAALAAEAPVKEAAPMSEPAAQTASAQADWRLLLVNPWNALPADYQVNLKSLDNGLQVDERVYDDLDAMLSGCRAAGLHPIACSAYRTQATQTRLYNNKVARLRAAGYSRESAKTEAARWVALPGTSEHQTGMALDLISKSYQVLDEKQADTPEQKWLMEHCWEYGFILRYPSDKCDVTGIGYEPWHYRYVGRETAAAIQAQGVCLEEYLNALPQAGESASAPTPERPLPTPAGASSAAPAAI